MTATNLKLVPKIIMLALAQMILNYSLHVSLDLIGIVIILLLLSKNFSFKSLILISLAADFMGHWYLGTHLLATLILSFFTLSIVNYFSICTFLHKTILLAFFYIILQLIIFLIGIIFHNGVVNILGFFIEIICIPIFLKLFDNILNKHSDNIIF